jgi:hypothetical protein
MKKLFAIACTLMLGGVMSFAQATGGATDSQTPKTTTPTSGKKAGKTKTKAHKGGKKSKKNAGGTTTPAPK